MKSKLLHQQDGRTRSCSTRASTGSGKDYLRIPFDEQVEALSSAATWHSRTGSPAIHAHVVVGRRDGSAAGGPLLEATVRPTLELILMETPAHLRKREGAESGLALIDLDAADDG